MKKIITWVKKQDKILAIIFIAGVFFLGVEASQFNGLIESWNDSFKEGDTIGSIMHLFLLLPLALIIISGKAILKDNEK